MQDAKCKIKGWLEGALIEKIMLNIENPLWFGRILVICNPNQFTRTHDTEKKPFFWQMVRRGCFCNCLCTFVGAYPYRMQTARYARIYTR